MSKQHPTEIEIISTRPLPQVNLTSRLFETLRQNQGPIRSQLNDCDCDCACAVEGQASMTTLSGPVACYLELTYSCPSQCPGCGNVFLDRQDPTVLAPPLHPSQWEFVLDKILPSVTMLKLTGGEPTHYPEFFSILDILQEKGVPFVLLSNGCWLDPSHLLDELGKCTNFRGFLISLHGPDAPTHEAFTATPGSFLSATSAICAAYRAGFDVAVSTVLVRPNLGLLRATAQVALELGAGHVVYGRHIGKPRQGLTLSEGELHRAIQEVQLLEKEGLPVKFGNCIPQCFERSSSTGCTAGRSFCTVDPWGNVRPCNHAHTIVGNLLTESLDEIWWSESMARWRQIASPDCLHCQAYPQCHGGCRALSYGYDADPLMKDPVNISSPRPQEQITLYTDAVPQSRYEVRSEPLGSMLICDGRVMPVTFNLLAFLQAVDNHRTLAQIQHEYGDAALSFIGELYLQRFIGLHVPDIVPIG